MKVITVAVVATAAGIQGGNHDNEAARLRLGDVEFRLSEDTRVVLEWRLRELHIFQLAVFADGTRPLSQPLSATHNVVIRL